MQEVGNDDESEEETLPVQNIGTMTRSELLDLLAVADLQRLGMERDDVVTEFGWARIMWVRLTQREKENILIASEDDGEILKFFLRKVLFLE